MADFRFTNEHSVSQVGDVMDVLCSPRLWIPTEHDYPAHAQWLGKSEAEILAGKKRAMLAYAGREPIGTVVYRRHNDQPNVVEIRNISVSPDTRGRFVGSFLLRNAELEAIGNEFPDTYGIVVDTKLTNAGMVAFLEHHGYELTDVSDLYGSGQVDGVFVKSFTT